MRLLTADKKKKLSCAPLIQALQSQEPVFKNKRLLRKVWPLLCLTRKRPIEALQSDVWLRSESIRVLKCVHLSVCAGCHVNSFCPCQLRLYAAVLQQGLLALSPTALWTMGVTLSSIAVLLIGTGSHARPRVLWDKQGHQQGQQHRARAKQEGGAWDDGTLRRREERKLSTAVTRAHYSVWLQVKGSVCVYLIRGVGHVGFGTFLRGICVT